MKGITRKRGLATLIPVTSICLAAASAWACTLGVGPTDGFFPMALDPPAAVLDGDGTVPVAATAAFNSSPPFSGTTTVHQDAGLGTLGSSFGNTVRVSGPLPDQCSTADLPAVGTMDWQNNIGEASLTLNAAPKSGGGYVPGVYEVCTFITTDKLNRFIAYFTFV